MGADVQIAILETEDGFDFVSFMCGLLLQFLEHELMNELLPEPITAVPLQGFFDDSGNGPTEKYFIWAGFLGSPGQFEKLAKEWTGILRDGTRIPIWHTFTAHQSIKTGAPYFGREISAVELSAKEARLATLLQKYGSDRRITRLAVRVNRAEHREQVVDKLRAKNEPLGVAKTLAESLKSPELIALHEVVMATANVAAQLASTPGNTSKGKYTQILFEERSGGADWQDSVCESVRLLRKLEEPDFRYTIGSVTFVPCGINSPIIIPSFDHSDMLAWHIRRLGINDSDSSEPLWPELASIPGGTKTISVSEMQSFVARVNDGERPWRVKA